MRGFTSKETICILEYDIINTNAFNGFWGDTILAGSLTLSDLCPGSCNFLENEVTFINVDVVKDSVDGGLGGIRVNW